MQSHLCDLYKRLSPLSPSSSHFSSLHHRLPSSRLTHTSLIRIPTSSYQTPRSLLRFKFVDIIFCNAEMAHLSQSDRALLRNILRALTDAGLDTIDVSSGTAAQKLIIARRGDISIDVNDKTLGWAARVFHRQGVFQMDEADRNALYPEPDQPPSTDEQSSSSTPELMTPDSTHHQDLLGVEQDRAGRDGEGATEGGGQGAPQPSPQASGTCRA